MAFGLLLSLATTNAFAGDDEIRTETECFAETGDGRSTLVAEFESRTKNGVTRKKFDIGLESQVEVIPAGTSLTFHIGVDSISASIGGADPDGSVGVELSFDTNPEDDGAFFPNVNSDSSIMVSATFGGGSFSLSCNLVELLE